MSTIYKITGNFEQEGEWIRPGFEGYFVQDDSMSIKGYMIEKYDLCGYSELRFIAGRYDDKTQELEFVKFSNERDLDTLIYLFKNAREMGTWAVISLSFGYIFRCGRGAVEVTPTSETTEEIVLSKFSGMNKNLRDHGEILSFLGEAKGMQQFANNLYAIIDK